MKVINGNKNQGSIIFEKDRNDIWILHWDWEIEE